MIALQAEKIQDALAQSMSRFLGWVPSCEWCGGDNNQNPVWWIVRRFIPDGIYLGYQEVRASMCCERCAREFLHREPPPIEWLLEAA